MEFISNSLQDTEKIAQELLKKITPPCTITLRGDLGAGKTAFTKLFAKALNITDIVTSPTFTLMNEYLDGTYPLYHFDMYRIENPEEIYELGFNDYFEDTNAIIICEWPDVVEEVLAKKGFNITIEKLGESQRKFIIEERK